MKAIITGATRGIGRSVAMAMASKGISTGLVARSTEDLEKLQKEILEKFPKAFVHVFSCDLSVMEQTIQAAKKIMKEMGAPDILVNNAGTYAEGGILSDDTDVFDRMMHLNFYVPYHLTKHLLPAMIGKGQGHIVNICSVASLDPVPAAGSYSISKAAMYAFTGSLRQEVKPFGIKVTAVIPGSTYTSSWDEPSIKDRLIQPEDIAEAIMTALHASSSCVTEEIILRPLNF